MLTITLPRQFSAENLFRLIHDTFGAFETIPAEVKFDFCKLGFVLPSGIVFLSNLSRFLLRNNCAVYYLNMDLSRECIRFMDDSLFFEQHMGEKLDPSCSPRPTTRPLMEISHTNSHNWIRSDLIPWLSTCSGVPEHDLTELASCIGELFNNIDDHTELDVGGIFAQWYPQKNIVAISIADFGVGIPSTVARIEPDLSDHEAIIKAFKDGFTSQSTPGNRGIGLHYLCQNVVRTLGGSLEVHSGNGSVKFKKAGDSVISMPYDRSGYCPGTLINLEFATDKIEITNAEVEDFEW